MTDVPVKCDKCGLNSVKMCSVCAKEYTGTTRDHLRTQSHQILKSLLRSIRLLPEAEIFELAKKHVKGLVKNTKPKKPKLSKSSSEESLTPKKKPIKKTVKST